MFVEVIVIEPGSKDAFREFKIWRILSGCCESLVSLALGSGDLRDLFEPADLARCFFAIWLLSSDYLLAAASRARRSKIAAIFCCNESTVNGFTMYCETPALAASRTFSRLASAVTIRKGVVL